MVPGTTRKKLLFTALLVAAFALGFAIAVSMWEGGWGVDDGSDSSESANRVLHNDSVLAAGGMGFLRHLSPAPFTKAEAGCCLWFGGIRRPRSVRRI
jgi:hypothetical protein